MSNKIISPKEYILSLSYGKNSLACLGAIEQLGWQLDRIVHVEVWATDTIPADLPPMVEFKAKADSIIKERWNIDVEHISADFTYEDIFYRFFSSGKRAGTIYGWPFLNGNWCLGYLKRSVFNKLGNNCIQYIGIATDEPNRFHNLSAIKKSPLVELGWDDAYCWRWCKENNLLSPIYSTTTRGGCWFCHNQSVGQLRLLRKNYPDLWSLLLKWDKDSPVSFRADGHTVYDFEKRFQLEDDGFILPSESWKWDFLNAELNYRWF